MYSDWRRVVGRQDTSDKAPANAKRKSPASPRPRTDDSGKPKRLSFKERREWEGLPGRIELLEQELGLLHENMAAPDFFKRDPEEIRKAKEDSQRLPGEIEALFSRWAELDERDGGEG